MNPIRFARKLLHDRPAAAASARLVFRKTRGDIHWLLRPNSILTYRLPTGGLILLGRNDSFTQCYWPGTEQYEADVAACFRRYLNPGQTFIDCGANVGLFSIMAWGLMSRNGRVVSIEANPDTCQRLARNLRANDLANPIGCAVNDTEGELSLYLPGEGDVYASLATGGLVSDQSRHVTVPAWTLDRIVEEQGLKTVDVIKIDVEGAEMSVLRSASETIRRFRPWLTVEYSSATWATFGATGDNLTAWCATNGYSIHVFDPRRDCVVTPPLDTWSRGYINLVLIPAERRASFAPGP